MNTKYEWSSTRVNRPRLYPLRTPLGGPGDTGVDLSGSFFRPPGSLLNRTL